MEDKDPLKKRKNEKFRALFWCLQIHSGRKPCVCEHPSPSFVFPVGRHYNLHVLEEPIPVWCQKGISLLAWKKKKKIKY